MPVCVRLFLTKKDKVLAGAEKWKRDLTLIRTAWTKSRRMTSSNARTPRSGRPGGGLCSGGKADVRMRLCRNGVLADDYVNAETRIHFIDKTFVLLMEIQTTSF
jgi:hypothetical protein